MHVEEEMRDFPRSPNLTASRLSWLSYSPASTRPVGRVLWWPQVFAALALEPLPSKGTVVPQRNSALGFTVFRCILLWEPVAAFCLLGICAVGRSDSCFLFCTFVPQGAPCPSQQWCSVSDHCLPVLFLNCCCSWAICRNTALCLLIVCLFNPFSAKLHLFCALEDWLLHVFFPPRLPLCFYMLPIRSCLLNYQEQQ